MIKQSLFTSGKLTSLYVAGFFLSILSLIILKGWNAIFIFIVFSLLTTFFISGIVLYFSLQNKAQVIGTTLITFIFLFFVMLVISMMIKITIISPDADEFTQNLYTNLLLLMALYTNIFVQTIFIISLFLLGLIVLYVKRKHTAGTPQTITLQKPAETTSIFHNFGLTILHYVHYLALFVYLYTFFNTIRHLVARSPLESSVQYVDFIQHLIALFIITPFYLFTLVYRRHTLTKHIHYATSITRQISRLSSLIVLLIFGSGLIGYEYLLIFKQLPAEKTTLLMYLYGAFFAGVLIYYLYCALVVKKEIRFHLLIAIVIGLTTSGVIYKAMNTFSYYPLKAIAADDTRIRDLQYIQQDIELYSKEHGTLPGSLEDLQSYNQSNVYSILDPTSKKIYEFAKLSDTSYQLCASFETDLNFTQISAKPMQHTKGYQCYTSEATFIPGLQANPTPIPTPPPAPPAPTTAPSPTPKKISAAVLQADTAAWGVAKQVDATTWTMKVQFDSSMATPQQIFNALNQYRSKHSRNPLSWDDNLANFAKQRVETFVQIKSTDKHEGFKQYTASQDNFKKIGFWSLGENSSYGYKLEGVHLIEWIFAGDAPHDDNQLSSAWSHVGIAVSDTAVDIVFGGGKI